MTHIASLTLSSNSSDASPEYLRHEQETAIADLTANCFFHPANDQNGPYNVIVSVENGRLLIRTIDVNGKELTAHLFALGPFRRLITDYFMMIESYQAARNGASCGKLEAIDMGRRGLHDEGASLVRERLKGKIDMDHETARRFFTLICVLHKGHARLAS